MKAKIISNILANVVNADKFSKVSKINNDIIGYNALNDTHYWVYYELTKLSYDELLIIQNIFNS
jgi:hypothetical protein